MVVRVLRFLRLRAGFSQEDLGRLVGVPQETISQYERGLEIIPSHAERLTQVLQSFTQLHLEPNDLGDPITTWRDRNQSLGGLITSKE